MSTFVTKLFRLINAADRIVVDGYEIDDVNYLSDGSARLVCDDDNEWLLVDQEVTVCDGVCSARVLEATDTDDPEEATIEFSVRRMIGPDDLSPDTP